MTDRSGMCLPLLKGLCAYFFYSLRDDDVGLRVLDEKQRQIESKWDAMSTKDKIGDWASRHEYSIILGGWALGLAVAGGVISRDPYVCLYPSCVHPADLIFSLQIPNILSKGSLFSCRDQCMLISFPQIVQVRMWAQGLTIGLLVAGGAMSHAKRAQAPTVRQDHSWREVVSVLDQVEIIYSLLCLCTQLQQYEQQTQEERDRIAAQAPTTRKGVIQL